MANGIKSIEDVKDRCWVDEETGCWHWRYAVSGLSKQPSCWVPGLGRSTTLGAALTFLLTGEDPRGTKKVMHVKCKTPGCANPDHRRLGTRKTQMTAAFKTERIKCTPERNMRNAIASAKRARITEEQAEAIRNDSRRLVDIAQEYGINVSYASALRRGEVRKPLPTRASSVFNWRPE